MDIRLPATTTLATEFIRAHLHSQRGGAVISMIKNNNILPAGEVSRHAYGKIVSLAAGIDKITNLHPGRQRSC